MHFSLFLHLDERLMPLTQRFIGGGYGAIRHRQPNVCFGTRIAARGSSGKLFRRRFAGAMTNKSSPLPSNRNECMKKMLIGLLSLGAVCSSQAQLFTSEGLTGAAWGGLLGAVIGHNSGRHGGEGAAIGAGAGFLLGTLAHHSNRDRYYYSSYGYADPSYGGYGYTGSYYPGYPGYYAYSQPSYYYSRPSYQAPAQPAPQAEAPVLNTSLNTTLIKSSSPMSSANSLFGR
jgi:hypothetical protein